VTGEERKKEARCMLRCIRAANLPTGGTTGRPLKSTIPQTKSQWGG